MLSLRDQASYLYLSIFHHDNYKLQILDLLLVYKANTTKEDDEEQTPLHLAAM